MTIENNGTYIEFVEGSLRTALKKSGIDSLRLRSDGVIVKMGSGRSHKLVWSSVTDPVTVNPEGLYNLLVAYQDTAGRAETFTSVGGQVVYTTTMTLPNVVLLFLDGVYQGNTNELAGAWDVTSAHEVTSAVAVGAGHQVTIMV